MSFSLALLPGSAEGGPVKLPGYNGKDRTFYFVSLEGTRQVASSTFSNVVVPSALERVGDFSQSRLPAGRAVVTGLPIRRLEAVT